MSGSRPIRTGIFGSLALAVAALAVAFLAAEGAVRWLGVDEGPQRVPGVPVAPASPGDDDLPELRSVRELARPGARGRFQGVLHRTNRQGVRGPEYAPSPPPGTFRIVVIGDSVTMGQGVEESAAYPAVLEARLAARTDGRRYEVVNLGIAGLATRHSVRRLEKTGIGYAPHLIVYGFTENDIEGPEYEGPDPADQAAYRTLVGRVDGSPSRLAQIVWPRLLRLISAWRPLPGTYEFVLEQNYFRNPAAWRQVSDGLARIAEIAAARGICAHVFVHTRMHELRGVHPLERIYRRVAEAARAIGLSASLALPIFRGRDARGLRLSDVDSHPNVRGHALLAESLLEALDALPQRCWEPTGIGSARAIE